MASHDTLFTVDPGAAGGAVQYVSDTFADVSLPATNNTGFSSTVSRNPMGGFYNDDDAPKYGVKTLYFKDLVLIDDRSKWISNKPTYQVVFNENPPGVTAYSFGDQYIYRLGDNRMVKYKTIGDGMGITGAFRKVVWIVSGSNVATATGQLAVDGSNTTTIDFSNASADSAVGDNVITSNVAPNILGIKHFTFDGSPSLQTKDIHDYRLTSLQVDTLRIVGVIIYYENSGVNIDLFPGTTYVNKTRSFTSTGATLALPTLGSSLGGRNTIYKTSTNSYGVTSTIAPMIQSIAQGSSGTNLATVTTGTGASFPVGSGVVMQTSGTSFYVGSVTNQSTDTLTVSPTLPFGVSGLIYKAWGSNATLAISSTQYIQSAIIGPTQWIAGITAGVLDPLGRWGSWGFNATTPIGSSQYPILSFPSGSSGFFQVDGYFSAAEIEFVGSGILHATLSVNGCPAWGINQAQTGTIKRTVFSDSGPGWNSFVISTGTSFGGVGINKIDLYEMRPNIGVSFGQLSYFDTEQTLTPRTAGYNATVMMLGSYRRYYGDQMGLQGSWARAVGSTFAGGHAYVGASTNSTVTMNLYFKNLTVIGTQGSSITISFDGVAQGASFNTLLSATEGFHNVVVAHKAGTSVIHAIDVSRTNAEMVNTQNYQPLPAIAKFANKRIPIMTEWFQYQPKIYAQTTDPIRATNAIDVGMWRRVGDCIEIMYYYKHTLAPANGASSGSGSYQLTLPDGINWDMRKLRKIDVDAGDAGIVIGNGVFSDNNFAVGVNDGVVITANGIGGTVLNENAVMCYIRNNLAATMILWGNGTAGFNFGTTSLIFSLKFGGPVYGWKVDE